MRHISFRKPLPRTRTPSLSRTTPSPNTSSSANSTPHSIRSFGPGTTPSRSESPLRALSIPLPPSNNASPADASWRTREPDAAADEASQPSGEGSASGSQEEREPTFSSEEADTPRSHGSSVAFSVHSPRTTALSSPTPSTMFTPTPAFQSRRARFQQIAPGLPATPRAPTGDEPATPYNRRRSFLLDVINSTARPRFAQPTPHPHRILDTPAPVQEEEYVDGEGEEGEEGEEETPAPATSVSSPEDSIAPLQAAFAGMTPAPRPRVRAAGRLSHPLTRGWTPDSDSEGAGGAASDAYVERASFVSTASSHDLTAHPRANASFDPVMGLGAGGHGISRFNANKLNSYLHGLNRRLQEESETLSGTVEMLKRETVELAEENAALLDEMEELREQVKRGGGRRSSGGRRVSDMQPTLRDVEEDVGGEGWMEEKAAMEDELETARAEVNRYESERDEVAQKLAEEQAERAKDKERWKDRMGEVERGVQVIIQDLEAKIEAAEAKAKGVVEKDEKIKELERALREAKEEKDFALKRVERAEHMLENGRELGGELREANEKLGQAMTELRTANAQVSELEDQLARAEDHIGELEQHAQDDRDGARKAQQQLEAREADINALEEHVTDRETALQRAEEELAQAKRYITELETESGGAVECIEALEQEIASEREKVVSATADANQAHLERERLEDEIERNMELARQLEDALKAAEKKMAEDHATIAELRGRTSNLERDLSRVDPSHNVPEDIAQEIAGLEAEVDELMRENAKLRHQLSNSPARQTIDKAKDARIQILEGEREDLIERLKAANLKTSPGKLGNLSNMSPMHRQVLSMTMRAPKTPGGPLSEMSWLQPSKTELSMSPYYSEIQRLQKELDRANENIDDKLDRLEDAGFGVVDLTQQLEDERARNTALEDDIARLHRREERRARRLEKARCTKCRSKVDLSGLNRAADGDESSFEISMMTLPSEPPTPPTRTSEALKSELRSVNKELTLMKKQWQEEKRQLLGDKATLQDAANRLNMQMREVQQRAADKERVGDKASGELEEARRVIADLEEELKTQRTRLRTLSTEQSKAEREKADVLVQLQRTESDMDDVRSHLQRVKRENHELEAELRTNTAAEQKARRMEAKASENAETIEQLRQERSMLATEHKKLQTRFRETSDHMNKLREEHAASQASHDNKRHALDLRLLEIDDLRRALAEKTETLQVMEAAQSKLTAGKEREREQERIVAALEADLARVRRNAEALGRDLRAERTRREEETRKREAERKEEKNKAGSTKKEVEEARKEAEKAERARKQAGAELRLLRERVGVLEGVKKDWEGHICAADDSQLTKLRAQHKLESKGLVVQIHYLKAKFTRENVLRTDLGYQKQYLLVLLGRHERGEEKVLASIARIGFPLSGPSSKGRRRTLKTVVLGVLFLQRARRAGEAWRKQCAMKPAVKAALEDVRRRRKGAGAGLSS
ncbi:hypothetical protein OF83DRAFT_909610 [Amylostereum chailletii]|nr:hypothetical protein OF83DRAFT_909610 [Amylostereum chailletii]